MRVNLFNRRKSQSESTSTRSTLTNYLHMLEDHGEDLLHTESHRHHQRPRRTPRVSYDTNDFEELFLQNVTEFQQTLDMFNRASVAKKGIPPASDCAISRLPRTRILPNDKERYKEDTAECGVCCDRLVDGIIIVRLPCGHIFHINCVVPWLTKHCTCPTCRYEMISNDPCYEKGRIERMKGRKVVKCACKISTVHECFRQDFESRLLQRKQEESPDKHQEAATDLLCNVCSPAAA